MPPVFLIAHLMIPDTSKNPTSPESLRQLFLVDHLIPRSATVDEGEGLDCIDASVKAA